MQNFSKQYTSQTRVDLVTYKYLYIIAFETWLKVYYYVKSLTPSKITKIH